MAKFCTECGAKAPADPATATTETVTEAKDTRVETPVVHTPPAQSYQAQQTYTQPAPDPASKVVSTGTFFGTMLLFALPFIGFIACIIMCFAPKRKSLKNYAKANLIWAIIGLVFSILLVVAVIAIGGSLMDYLSEAMGGGLGDLSGMQ